MLGLFIVWLSIFISGLSMCCLILLCSWNSLLKLVKGWWKVKVLLMVIGWKLVVSVVLFVWLLWWFVDCVCWMLMVSRWRLLGFCCIGVLKVWFVKVILLIFWCLMLVILICKCWSIRCFWLILRKCKEWFNGDGNLRYY